MKKLVLLTLLSFMIMPVLFAQSKYKIEGKVLDKASGEPIPYAQVILKQTGQWSVTNENGVFKITDVYSGTYSLEAFVLGYVSYEIPITVNRDINSFVIQLKEDNLKLEEIVVTAKSGSSINSSNKIDKKAIEHIQASSVADIMQLLPGGIVSNPNLTSANNIKLRSVSISDTKNNEARGVAYIVNGTHISSDASMGIGVGDGAKSGDISVPVTDYRNYSTDNIESVEVLKGVISAEYGDVTSGAVLVKTKAGRTPFEIRLKTDPKLKAVAANKGFSVSKKGGYINIDADYARATSDLRSPVKTFDRANVGITYSNTFNTNSTPFRFNARLTGSYIANNAKSDPDVARDDFVKDQKKNLMLSFYGNWMLNKSWISTLNYNFSLNYSKNTIREFTSKTGNMFPNTSTYEPGLNLGFFNPASYNEDRRVEDSPFYANAKVSGVLNKKAGGTLFTTTLGIEWNSKGNLGDGMWYVGAAPQWFRQRKFTDIPFMHDFAAYLNQKAIIPISKTSLEVNAGLRVTKLIIDGYDYNAVLDPRFNAKYNIIKNKRKQFISDFAIRGGWGLMNKLPSLSLLYAGDAYLDRAVFQYNNSTTNQQLALINTYVVSEKLGYNIKPVKSRNLEIGADMVIGGVEIGLTYFNENMKNGISENYNILREQIFYYDNVNSSTAAPKFEDGKIWIKNEKGEYVVAPGKLVNEYIKKATPDNRNSMKKWGIEYELDFGKIKPINTSILVNGAYIRNDYDVKGLIQCSSNNADPLDANKKFPYIGIYDGNENRIFNSKTADRFSTNVSFITNIPKIRMVVSLMVQCVWMERDWNNFDKSIYYLDENGNRVFEDFSKEITDKQFYRDPVAYVDFEGVVRPFSDYYTTEDPALKARLATMRITDSKSYNFAVNSYNPYFMANLRVTKEIGNIASISFYANNFTNSKPIMKNSAQPNTIGYRKNTDIYFGAELRLTF